MKTKIGSVSVALRQEQVCVLIGLWLMLLCASARGGAIHNFTDDLFELDGCKSVRGAVPGTTEGAYNEGVELCAVKADVAAVQLKVGDRVVIKWLASSADVGRPGADAEKECRALQLAAGSSLKNSSHGEVGSRGVVHCYGVVDSQSGFKGARRFGIVMMPLDAITLSEKEPEFILTSMKEGGLVYDALLALSRLYINGLGCPDCEWAWVNQRAESGRLLLGAKLYDTGGPATQFEDSIAQQDRRLKCGQYHGVFEYLVMLLEDIQNIEAALGAEAEKLYAMLGEFEEGKAGGAEAVNPKNWPEENECPDFCIADSGAFAHWFEGKLSDEGGGKDDHRPLSIVTCLSDDSDERCSVLSQLIFSFFTQVECKGLGAGSDLPGMTAYRLENAVHEDVLAKQHQIRREALEHRLEERKSQKRRGAGGAAGR